MGEFVEDLLERWQSYQKRLPQLADGKLLIDSVLGLLFPQRATVQLDSVAAIQGEVWKLESFLREFMLQFEPAFERPATEIVYTFMASLPSIHLQLLEDAEAILKGDPAAAGIDEVIIAYPGFFAIAVYRIAHEFYLQKIPILPRVLTEFAHQVTGIDIHPGATIGGSFFIDHGTGIVIGETTIIEDNVKIYQGVTLGALSVEKRFANKKRHPTIESNVVIYSNATILGGDTVIGHHSIIGGNVWVTASVPPESVIYHHSEVKIKSSKGDKGSNSLKGKK